MTRCVAPKPVTIIDDDRDRPGAGTVTMTPDRGRRFRLGLMSIDHVRTRVLIFLAIMIPQIVCLAAFWPGKMQFDHAIILTQIWAGQPSEWHSTLWGWLAYPITSRVSYGWYGLIQILIQTSLESWCVISMARRGIIGRGWTIALTIIYAVCPSFLMFGLLWGTDTLFAVLMMMLTTLLIIIDHDHDEIKKWQIRMIMGIVIFWMMEFRKNALLLVPVIMLVWIIKFGRGRGPRLRSIALVLIIPILAYGVLEATFREIGVTPSPSQEMVAVPALQVARVAHDGGSVSPWAKSVFERTRSWQKWKQSYKWNLADAAKARLTVTGDFMKAWAETGIRNPGLYWSTWVNLMSPYWSITPTAGSYGDMVKGDFLWSTPGVSYTRGNEQSYRDALDTYHYAASMTVANKRMIVAYDSVYNTKIPLLGDVVRILAFNQSVPLWTLVATMIIAARRRRMRSWMLVAGAPVYIMLTLFTFTPMALVRYALQIGWTAPVLIAWAASIPHRRSGTADVTGTESRRTS